MVLSGIIWGLMEEGKTSRQTTCVTWTKAREGVLYHELVHFREMKAPVSGDKVK